VQLPQELATLMAEQDAMATVDQLAAHGITRWRRTQLAADGWIVRVAPRVYRLRGAPHSTRWRLRAGLLSLGPGSCVSFESAATLHEFPDADRSAVEFTIARRRRSVVTPFIVHTPDRLDAVDVTPRFGLATTTPARTLIDLALAGASDERLTSTIVAAVDRGALSLDELASRLEALRRPGRWGSRRLERIVDGLAGSTAGTGDTPGATRRSPPVETGGLRRR